MRLRAALKYNQRHPELDFRADALLCSINERLGAIVRHFLAGPTGDDFEPLSDAYLGDLLACAFYEAEEAPELPDLGP